MDQAVQVANPSTEPVGPSAKTLAVHIELASKMIATKTLVEGLMSSINRVHQARRQRVPRPQGPFRSTHGDHLINRSSNISVNYRMGQQTPKSGQISSTSNINLGQVFFFFFLHAQKIVHPDTKMEEDKFHTCKNLQRVQPPPLPRQRWKVRGPCRSFTGFTGTLGFQRETMKDEPVFCGIQ